MVSPAQNAVIGNTSPRSVFERTPPQNLEAEISVLGGMMLSKDAIGDVIEVLRSSDFYRPQHASIFEVILDLFSRGEPADPITVAAALKNEGKLEQVGGAAYLHTLVSAVPTAANAGYYGQIVRNMARLRALVEAGTRIVQLGYSDIGEDVDRIIDTAQAEMFNVLAEHVNKDYADVEEILPEVIAEIEANMARDGQLAGLATGFTDLDDKLAGLRPGQMVIIAARPGMGKSTLAMDFCRYAAIEQKIPVAFFSLEMNRTELVMRALAAESDVHLTKLIKGKLDTPDWKRISLAVQKMGEAPLYVDDSPNLTMMEIRAKARRLRQQNNIQLLVIDYLQLLTSGGRTPESRQQEVSDFSRSIKLLAKELEIPIIAVAQLNRNPEARQDKRPQVSDLRESGSLEQDADVILLIHRTDNSDPMNPPPSEIIVGKNRSGPTGSVELMFQGERARFSNMGVAINY